jgi:hypothetical protein
MISNTHKPAFLPLLLRLPTELHCEIFSHLQDAHDNTDLLLIPLCLTNQYFHDLIPATDHATLLCFEQTPFARSRKFYACSKCVRLRPARVFSYTMLYGKTGVHGKSPDKRFCADCGFTKPQGYSPGSEAYVDEERWVWCIHCREVKKGEEAGESAALSWRGCSKACKACFKRTSTPIHLECCGPGKFQCSCCYVSL